MILYHAPYSRSSTMVTLLHELDAIDAVTIQPVTIQRPGNADTKRDSRNPHPEGKVPFLTAGDDTVRERAAIVIYLCQCFPQAGLGRNFGDPDYGRFLSWLCYYQGVVEPVLVAKFTQMENDALKSSFGNFSEMSRNISEGLADKDYLLGQISAADILMASPFMFFPDFCPDDAKIKAWVRRLSERPSFAKTAQYDKELMSPHH
ncbi:glutathione S-transferase family protein [Thioclava sp. SK-1]|uniref:glutathione S-transferase family protein n=1 Tax=Thioclava sp. SK-1 TaxID=1889770 RepID=UPI002101347E|nr:glutathione S-transferase family protein [Thioclava sp. SK-1]